MEVWRLLLCFKSRDSINVVLAFFKGFMMVLHHHLFQNTIACSKSNMAKFNKKYIKIYNVELVSLIYLNIVFI